MTRQIAIAVLTIAFSTSARAAVGFDGCVSSGRCGGDTMCADDGNTGTFDVCSAAGECIHCPLPSASCADDPEVCDDGDPCTADACGASGCVNRRQEGCGIGTLMTNGPEPTLVVPPLTVESPGAITTAATVSADLPTPEEQAAGCDVGAGAQGSPLAAIGLLAAAALLARRCRRAR